MCAVVVAGSQSGAGIFFAGSGGKVQEIYETIFKQQ
jgi:hypothetical protein